MPEGTSRPTVTVIGPTTVASAADALAYSSLGNVFGKARDDGRSPSPGRRGEDFVVADTLAELVAGMNKLASQSLGDGVTDPAGR